MNALVTTFAQPSDARGLVRLVQYDVRRFRWLALLLVALEVSRAAFVEWAAHVVPPVLGERFGGTLGTQEVAVLDVIVWLATILATALLVQADLPSDDRAFWRARPVPPVVLALAKLATLALLMVAIPAAINAARLLAYGAPLASIGAATLQVAVGVGHAIVPAWALALATRTLPRFCTVAVAGAIGGALIIGAAVYWAEVVFGHADTGVALAARRFVVDWQRLDIHGWWGAAAATAAGTAILVAHYRHRRPSLSAGVAAILLLVPWLLPPRAGDPAPPAIAALAASLAIDPIALPPASGGPRSPRAAIPVRIQVPVSTPGWPRDVSAGVRLIDPRVVGTRALRPADGSSCCFGVGPAAAVAPSYAPPLRQSVTVGLDLPSADLEALRVPAVAVETDVELRFARHHWVATLPLRAGSAFRSGNQVIEVLACAPDRRTILLRYTRFPDLDDRRVGWTLFAGPAARTLLSPVWQGWGADNPAEALRGRPYSWFHGRTWVGRFHAVIGDRAAAGADPRLFVVESGAAGVTRARLEKTGVRVVHPDAFGSR